MEAKITITMTATEFDLVREALVEQADADRAIAGTTTASAPVRQAARGRSVLLRDLAHKLGK